MKKYQSFTDFFDNKRSEVQTYEKNDEDEKDVEKNENGGNISTKELTPIEQIDHAFGLLNKELEDEILEHVKSLSPRAFEKLVVDLLIKMGYGDIDDNTEAVTNFSHDHGIDGIISADKLGFDKIYIQAKQYSSTKVGSPDLQAFVGASISSFKLVFITTSGFTKEAQDYAKQIASSRQKLVLIDGVKLSRLMIEFNVGVQPQTQYVLKRVDSDFFTNYV